MYDIKKSRGFSHTKENGWCSLNVQRLRPLFNDKRVFVIDWYEFLLRDAHNRRPIRRK